jgi:hypothetical protein
MKGAAYLNKISKHILFYKDYFICTRIADVKDDDLINKTNGGLIDWVKTKLPSKGNIIIM